jgi:hypothetical protein
LVFYVRSRGFFTRGKVEPESYPANVRCSFQPDVPTKVKFRHTSIDLNIEIGYLKAHLNCHSGPELFRVNRECKSFYGRQCSG